MNNLFSPLLENLSFGIFVFDTSKDCIYTNNYIRLTIDKNKDDREIDYHQDIWQLFIDNIHEEYYDNEIKLNHNFFYDHVETISFINVYDVSKSKYTRFKIVRTISFINNFPLYYIICLYEIDNNYNRDKVYNIKNDEEYKNRFLATISHELRTPLNGIIGIMNLLEDTSLNNTQIDYISMIKQCSSNLLAVINDVLDYSKLERGEISIKNTEVNLQTCIESTNDIIISKIYEKSLNYSYNINENIPEILYLDSNRLKQIILNLLNNAIKYTDIGSITLNVKRIPLQELSDILKIKPVITHKNTIYLRFDIEDTGFGIDLQDKKKLFKTFSQIDNFLADTVYTGTGLGLVISKELVELMGGYIWLDWSEPNKGSRFSFVIQTEKSEKPIGKKLSKNKTDNSHFDKNSLENKNILVIDSDVFTRLTIAKFLKELKGNPFVFSTTEEAILFCKYTKFDLIVIDITCLDIKWKNFVSSIKTVSDTCNIPIIGLSKLKSEYTQENLPENICCIISKPLKKDKFQTEIIENISSTDKVGNLNDEYYNDKLEDNKIEHVYYKQTKVLLAEDVYVNRKVMLSYLQKHGFIDITVAENGKRCLELLINNYYDIVFMDIKMPYLSGISVLEEYKKYKNTDNKKTIFVAITAYLLSEQDSINYYNTGFDFFLTKPIDFTELKNLLQKTVL